MKPPPSFQFTPPGKVNVAGTKKWGGPKPGDMRTWKPIIQMHLGFLWSIPSSRTQPIHPTCGVKKPHRHSDRHVFYGKQKIMPNMEPKIFRWSGEAAVFRGCNSHPPGDEKFVTFYFIPLFLGPRTIPTISSWIIKSPIPKKGHKLAEFARHSIFGKLSIWSWLSEPKQAWRYRWLGPFCAETHHIQSSVATSMSHEKKTLPYF